MEKEKDRNIDVQEIHPSVASRTPPTGDPACNPGMCPNWELNQLPFSLQASTQSTEPHHPGLDSYFLFNHSLLNFFLERLKVGFKKHTI